MKRLIQILSLLAFVSLAHSATDYYDIFSLIRSTNAADSPPGAALGPLRYLDWTQRDSLAPADTFALPDSASQAARKKARWHYIALTDSARNAGFFAMRARPLGARAERPPRLFRRLGSADFVQSGSISRGISFGTRRDLSVDSDFSFEAFGRIGREMEIRAVLSDRASPIQPEGRTQALSELDKVYIEAESPGFGARFGDIEIEMDGSRFLRFSRQLSGMQLRGGGEMAQIRASGAVLAGTQRQMVITGREGNQGPYQLASEDGETDIVVIAGSETVWIDGRKQERGESADYIIDYNAADIEFMPRRAIDAQSRILVDFEYVSQDYSTTMFTTGGQILARGLFALSADVYRSSDDADNPLGFTLTDGDRERFSRLGDNADSAFASSAVADSLGDYDQLDSLGQQIFVYVGDSLGDWTVGFSRISGGSYVQRDSFFVWVGEGLGDFEPIVEVSLPKSHTAFSVGLVADTSLPVEIELELAGSSFDANTYSAADDGDNLGYADFARVAFSPFGLLGGQFQLGWEHFGTGRDFRSPGRIVDAEFGPNWGTAAARDPSGVSIHTVELALRGSPGVSASVTGALRDDDNGYSGERIMADAQLGSKMRRLGFSGLLLSAERDSAHTERARMRADGAFALTSGIIPAIDFEYDDNERRVSDSSSGQLFYELEQSTQIAIGRFMLVPAFGGKGVEEYLPGENREQFSSTIYGGLGVESDVLDLYYQRRDYRAHAPDAGADVVTDMGELDYRVSLSPASIKSSGSYRITGAQSERKERVYTYVGSGNGDYEYDELRDEYFISSRGEYVLEYKGSGVFVPTTDIELSSRLSASSRGVLPAGFPGSIEFSANINSEQSLADRGSAGFVPQVNGFFSDTLIREGRFRMNNQLKWTNRPFYARMGVDYYKYANRIWLSGSELGRQLSPYVEFDYDFGGLRGNMRLEREQSQRFFPAGTRTNEKLHTNRAQLELTYTKGRTLLPSVELAVFSGRDEGTADEYGVFGFGFVPALRLSFSRGSIFAQGSYFRISTDDNAPILPYELARGRLVGGNLDWDIRANLRLYPKFIQTFSYIGERLPGQETEHRFEARLQYIF